MLMNGRPIVVRRGMTLIELLVVMVIILAIIGLGYLALPSYADRKMTFAADRLQGWLLNAKMQAKREGRNCGLRIPVGATSTATTLIYILQPDDYAPANYTCAGAVVGGTYTVAPVTPILVASTATDQAPVQLGDYIEFLRSGPVYQISSVQYTGLQLTSLTTVSTGPTNSSMSFRVLRAPRPQIAEEDLTLPDEVAVDFNGSPTRSQVPVRSVNGTLFHEILFSPSGSVVGSGTTQGNINLWLSDTNDMNNINKRALLVTVQPGTGMISINNVATGADPYLYTKDGRLSGM